MPLAILRVCHPPRQCHADAVAITEIARHRRDPSLIGDRSVGPGERNGVDQVQVRIVLIDASRELP
jgi:hypothetical protein